VNDEERKETLTRFAKAIGDAASVIALAFVGIGAAVQECTEALERLNKAAREAGDDADRT
jgi:hypothetical protein